MKLTSQNNHHLRTRQHWVYQFCGNAIPRLWCPPLTHYKAPGIVDDERMHTHWRVMGKFVGGFLVPGSTGDAWEMRPSEIDQLVDSALNIASVIDTHILIGVLHPSIEQTLLSIEHILEKLASRFCQSDWHQNLKNARIAGFTVCPPTGRDLSQNQIKSALEAVLKLELPIALYQLPQMTHNSMSSDLVLDLAQRFPNFIFFKDSSGKDTVASSISGSSDLFMARGAEGSYACWLNEAGGPYQGFLLSTANCFAAEYAQMLHLLAAGQLEQAQGQSKNLAQVINKVFNLVASLPYGNPFSNANKAIDHWMAYGKDAIKAPLPLVYCGEKLPTKLLAEVGGLLAKAEFLPDVGYLKAGSVA